MSRPVIALTSDVRRDRRTMVFLFEEYALAIEEAGGLPLQVPPLRDPSLVAQVLKIADGVLIVGGEDIDPRVYGEEPLPTHQPIPNERFAFDWALANALLAPDNRHPVLGVCYGCQLLAAASGGALHQDIPAQVGATIEHSGRYPDLPMHPIVVTPGTRLHALAGGSLGAASLSVNSAHHQAPKRLGAGLMVSARAPDGVIEAFELAPPKDPKATEKEAGAAPPPNPAAKDGARFLLGLEWHPELLRTRPFERAIFGAFVEAAARKEKE
jgi:putative glutamine amidotransferase